MGLLAYADPNDNNSKNQAGTMEANVSSVGGSPEINNGNGECKICVSPVGRYANTNPSNATTTTAPAGPSGSTTGDGQNK